MQKRSRVESDDSDNGLGFASGTRTGNDNDDDNDNQPRLATAGNKKKATYIDSDDEEGSINSRRVTTFVNSQAIEDDGADEDNIRLTGAGKLNRANQNDNDY